jgi:signal transduction histidine kinase
VARTTLDIAHEFDNVISVIRGSADLAKRRLDSDHPAAADLSRILRVSDEALELTQELREVMCEEDGSWALP